jgi:hypothetical protein
VLENTVNEGGGLTVYNYNEYVPSALAPGYSLLGTMDAICTSAVGQATLCTWRMHVKGSGVLIGNLVVTPTGQVGNIQNGTNNFQKAKGLYSATNIAPGVSTDNFVFTT